MLRKVRHGIITWGMNRMTDSQNDFGCLSGPVALSYCENYSKGNVTKSLHAVMDCLGGMGKFVFPGERVLIKPNLLKAVSPEAHATTHPAVIEAVVRQVLDCGCRPFIGDSPAFGGLSSVAATAGIADICKRYSIPLVPFSSPVAVRLSSSWVEKIAIDRAVLQADKIINVPKLKTHVQVGFSGAVKNLFGCVVGKRKPIWHFRAGDGEHLFGEMLIGVYKAVSPALHIIDGVIAMEGNGPVSGKPRPLGLVAASVDGLSLDRVLCGIIGMPVYSVEIFAALRRHYNRDIDIKEVEIRGDLLSSFVKNDFLMPERAPIRFNIPRICISVLKHLKLRLLARMQE